MSDGVAAVRQLLVNHAPLIALVPAARISAGPLGLGVSLPAIGINSLSTIDRNIPNPGIYRHVRERVRVTVFSPAYPLTKQLIAEVRHAVADKSPSVAGLLNVIIQTDGGGADYINSEASIWMADQDFISTYSEAR